MRHLVGFDLVYFVQAQMSEGLIKIGATSDFPKRFNGLVGGSPCRLHLLGIQLSESAYALEGKLHQKFTSVRDHGEWFHPVPELLTYVEQHTTQPTQIAVKIEAREATANEINDLLNQLELRPLANVSQIARACNVSIQSVRRHVNDRKIPFVRVGRQLRFDMREFFKGRQMDVKRCATVDGAVVARSDLAPDRVRAGFLKVTDDPTTQAALHNANKKQ